MMMMSEKFKDGNSVPKSIKTFLQLFCTEINVKLISWLGTNLLCTKFLFQLLSFRLFRISKIFIEQALKLSLWKFVQQQMEWIAWIRTTWNNLYFAVVFFCYCCRILLTRNLLKEIYIVTFQTTRMSENLSLTL